MALLTNEMIESLLGGRVAGTELYDALAPTASVKAQYISIADATVVAAALKGGYSTVSTTGPVPASGEALTILQMMAFKVWMRLAMGYGKAVTVPADLDALMPDAAALYSQQENERLDLPGLARDQIGGDGGQTIEAGGTVTNPSTQLFSRNKLRMY